MYVCLYFSFLYVFFSLGVCLLCLRVWTQVCRCWTTRRKRKKGEKQRVRSDFFWREHREQKNKKLRVEQKTQREKQKTKERARGRVNYCHRYKDLWGAVHAIEEPQSNKTYPVYLFQVSSFYVFLVSVSFGFQPPSWVKNCKVICLLVYPPNRVRIVAKVVALRLVHPL